MFRLTLTCAESERELLEAELWERGTSGVAEEELAGGGWLLKAFFDQRSDAAGLERFHPAWEREPDTDWEALARACWPPLIVGERFYLAPAWRDDPTPEGRLRLEVHPGMACGTGYHPATQLCLEAMESELRPGGTVLDVGTGSGILAEGARLLGAGRVAACDIDPAAVGIARANLGTASGVLLFAGSVRSVRAGAADLVVANINAVTAASLAAEFRRVLKPGGAAIVSGFEERERARVQAAFPAARSLEREGWVCLVARR